MVTICNSGKKLIKKGLQNRNVKTCFTDIQILFEISIKKLKDQGEFPLRVDYVI
jgi:hypothetical protein